MAFSVRVNLAEVDYLRLAEFMMRKWMSVLAVICILLIWPWGFMRMAQGFGLQGGIILAAAIVLPFVLGRILRGMVRNTIHRNASLRKRPEGVFAFTEDGFSYRVEGGDGEEKSFRWDGLERLSETPGYYYLAARGSVTYILPKEQVDPAEREALGAFLRKSAGRRYKRRAG